MDGKGWWGGGGGGGGVGGKKKRDRKRQTDRDKTETGRKGWVDLAGVDAPVALVD